MNDRMTRREFLSASASLAAGASIAVSLGSTLAGSALGAGATPTTAPEKKEDQKLPTRPLGQTGFNAAILGLGGDGLISESKDKDAVIKFVTAVLDYGVNFIDTAYTYGRCESNLGLVMGTARRKDIFLATKTGARKYDSAMKQIEESLKRLQVTSLDLLQLHHVTDEDDIKAFGAKSGVIAAIRKLQDQKVVRFIGITGHPDSANVKKAMEMYDFDTLMCFVNPAKFSRPAMAEQLPLAVKKKMGVIAMKTFGGRPGQIVGDKGADAASLLRYSLSQDISVAIPGVANIEQFEANLKVARSFTPMTKEEIAAVTDQLNAKAGTWKR